VKYQHKSDNEQFVLKSTIQTNPTDSYQEFKSKEYVGHIIFSTEVCLTS
jgi:hypothetical protein